MTTSDIAIDVRHLSRRFGQFTAVDDLSFEVRRGEIFGFLGANGAGKSTTIRMLCGLLQPTSGTARVGGVDVKTDPEGVKERIGYMSQRFSLYELLTVDQNIRFFAGVYGLDAARMARLPLAQHGFHVLPLQVFLRAAERARNDRKLLQLRVRLEVRLLAVGERTDDDVPAVVGDELGRHRFQFSPVEHVQEEGLEDVVAMVSKRDAGRAELGGHTVKHPAAQP